MPIGCAVAQIQSNPIQEIIMKLVRIAMLAAALFGSLAAIPQAALAQSADANAKVALFVRLKAKPGKEAEVAAFLLSGKPIVEDEPATSTWFAIRLGPSSFAIFDTFPDDAGRNAHLAGKVAAALMAKAPNLLAVPPSIQKADVLATKLVAARSGN
jgi:quinol monooxygenase YgiN